MPTFTIHINRNALKYNFERVQSLAPNSKIMALIKSNAYGHGLINVAETLSDADAFGVASTMEAKLLRKAGIKKPILLLSYFSTFKELVEIANMNAEITLYDHTQLIALENAHLSTKLHVWLKINTGMNRLGFWPDEVDEIYNRLIHCKNVHQPIKLMTHFDNADNPGNPKTKQQIKKFHQTTRKLVGEKSLANSGGILAFPSSHADWIRPGIMLYGCSPFINQTGKDNDLQPVMTLYSELIAIRQQRKGDTIGYGSTFCCPENMPVGVIALGYGEGYPRHIKASTPVLIHGHLCKIIGRVSMNMLTVDLRNNSHAKVGDRVTLWGNDLPVEHIAACAGTIPYEILCHVNPLFKTVIFSA